MPDPAKCTAKSSRTGRPCQKLPIKGSTVCRTHGGSAPQVIKAAERRTEVEQAQKRLAALVATMPGTGSADPQEIIVKLLHDSQMVCAAYRLMLVEDPAAKILVEVSYGVQGVRLEQHPVALLWDKERDRLAKIAVDAAKIGIAERTVRLQESQVAEFAGIVERALARAGLSAAERLKVGQAMAAEMRLMDAVA